MPLLKRRHPSTLLSSQITAAAGIWNAQAGTIATSCASILIVPLPSPLPCITEHNGTRVLEPAEDGGKTSRREAKAVSAVSVLRRPLPADWPPFRLGHVSVRMSPVPRAHPECEAGTHRMKRSPRHQPATGLLRESCVEEHGQTAVAQLTRPPTGTEI